MQNTWIIYCHLNKINNKRYIGLTKFSTNPNARWRAGLGYTAKHHKIFAAAIEKYGWENFEHIVLEDNIESLEKANEREKYWIAYYHTFVGDEENWGYNATPGGDGTCGRIVSEKERELRRQLKLGTKASKETKLKMSNTRRGKKQHMTDKKLSQIKNMQKQAAIARSKAIRCIETNIVYKSITEAAEQMNIAQTTISACLNGRQKTAAGYHWAFVAKNKEN